MLQSIRDIVPKGVTCIYIRQGEPLGLGHAVLCARAAVGNEPFFVHLADDLIAGDPPCLAQMAAEHGRHGGSVVAVETVFKVGHRILGFYLLRTSRVSIFVAHAPTLLRVS